MSKPSPAIDNVVEAIRQRDAGRDPERLAMRYAKMKESPFVFLRGACHLFYDALPAVAAIDQAPLAWNCGDLHFENFGSYEADNGLLYFDINDFDESALAPCVWDLIRLLTSLHCGTDVLRISASEARQVGAACLDAYRDALIRGKPLWVERDTASGLVRELFDGLSEKRHGEFIKRRTESSDGRLKIKIDGVKALAATADERDAVAGLIQRFAAEQPKPEFFKVLDVARRIAGTGSLGIMRYVILVEGKGEPDGHYLLDLKAAKDSSLVPRLTQINIDQPASSDPACRIVDAQKRLQAVDHAFLHALDFAGTPSVLKILQPAEDRVAIGDWGKKIERLEDVVRTMGRVLAWDQLRATGRAGAATADTLHDFAQSENWGKEVLNLAEFMTDTTRRQWEEFRDAGL